MGHPTARERVAVGRAARTDAPRSSQSALELTDNRDPIALLEAQDASRDTTLVPIRYGRMAVSPLAFLRGAATVMAHDLETTPNAGLQVQLCGDAHLLNFGGFASPERDLVFDLNDFDETLPGPFEWDVKRLAASFEVAARQRDLTDVERTELVVGVARAYRNAIRQFARLGDLDVWYSRLDVRSIVKELRAGHDRKLASTLRRSARRAQANDGLLALAKLTREVDGEPRIVSDPPLIVPLSELVPVQADATDVESRIRATFRGYRHSIPGDLRTLLERFSYADLARKVVGIGSVGTRCWVMLLIGTDERSPLFLQIKEAGASVLEPLLGESSLTNHGQRVVEGQRLMQASSDIFLGWARDENDRDAGRRDYYVRQLRDWKTSIDIESILPSGLRVYASVCGWTLARAHARSGDRIAIAAYLGGTERFDRAVAEFSSTYADLNERDHGALRRAVDEGRIVALEGV